MLLGVGSQPRDLLLPPPLPSPHLGPRVGGPWDQPRSGGREVVWCWFWQLPDQSLLPEGGERWGRRWLPSQPTTWAPRPAKQVNVLSFCNKGME